MATPATRSAIRVITPGNIEIQSDVPAPRLRPDYIIAEAKAWALNPTDIAHVDRLGGPGTIVGCDWSGVVTAVGENVTRFKPGDAVSGVCHGGNTVEPEDGAYSNIVISKELATMHKPASLSFAEAVSLGVGMATIGQALYWFMKLRLPSVDGVTPEASTGPAVFVYGGSSATGSLAIQALKQSGYKVYTACSPSNFDLVKSRGADAWFDYNLPTCADDILATVAADSSYIGYILDCIGNESSATLCAAILSSSGGRYHSIKPPVPAPLKTLRPDENVLGTTALAYAMTGESFELPPGTVHPADPQQAEFAKEWSVLGEKLIAAGKIRPHPVHVSGGGLEGVLKAIADMRGDGPRGVKIVVTE